MRKGYRYLKQIYKKNNERLGINSLGFRVFLIIAVIILMALSTTAIIFFKTFEATLIKEIGNNRVDVLSQIGERVKLIKNSSRTLSNLYCYDKNLKEFLSSSNPKAEMPNKYLEEITEKYKIAFNEVGMDYYIVIIGDNGYNYYSDLGTREYDYIEPKKKVWYKDIFLNKGNIYWVSSFKDVHRNENVFSAARVLKDNRGKDAGVLLVNVNERLLYDTYKNVLTDTNSIYIVDEEGSIVSSKDERMLGLNFFHINRLRQLFKEMPYTILDIGGRTVLFTSYIEDTTGWTILEEIPIEEVMVPIYQVRDKIVFITIGIIIIGLLVAYTYANQVAKPIKKLCCFLQNIQDEQFESECEVTGWNEIIILTKGLNEMLRRIKNLLEGIKQKEQQKRKIELSFLQAQINPHFMYNTLFSIKCMVDMERNEEATQMLTAFIQLLRSTLSSPDKFITLEEEFRTLDQYVVLQQFRYSGNFKVNFTYNQEILHYHIPKLLIQPLLENAIFHGVDIKKEEGRINIEAKEREGTIYITIEDNGVGISKEIIKKIDEGIKLNNQDHIGVFNVKERINLNFGDKYGLYIESQEWKGTKILLKLPAIE